MLMLQKRNGQEKIKAIAEVVCFVFVTQNSTGVMINDGFDYIPGSVYTSILINY